MPLGCRHKAALGREFCFSRCPSAQPGGPFLHRRIVSPGDVPAPDARTVDVAILDMNHGWPNLGHDSIVHAVAEAVCNLEPELGEAGLQVRTLSYEVRSRAMIPEPPPARFALYIGTGGPGDLDPRRNDGVSPGAQGLVEDPSWEAPLHRLFDAILADGEAALLGVCHSFGVMCLWSGAARPALRGPEKGGKSSGVLENVFTPAGQAHPWFQRFASELPEGRLPIVDSRLFDLLPPAAGPPRSVVPIAYETLGIGGPPGDAVTMLEFARDAGGVMPRVFGVNHHPEIVDRERQLMILHQKRERGEVSAEWCAERAAILAGFGTGPEGGRRLHLTSDYTLLGPLRYHLYRQVRRRAEALGLRVAVHEEQVLVDLAAVH
jgi:hypothetical protein